MTDEAEQDPDIEVYTPEPCVLSCPGGDVLIFDPYEFAEHYKCKAVQYTEHGLFILRDGSGWVNIEKSEQPAEGKVTPFGKRH